MRCHDPQSKIILLGLPRSNTRKAGILSLRRPTGPNLCSFHTRAFVFQRPVTCTSFSLSHKNVSIWNGTLCEKEPFLIRKKYSWKFQSFEWVAFLVGSDWIQILFQGLHYFNNWVCFQKKKQIWTAFLSFESVSQSDNTQSHLTHLHNFLRCLVMCDCHRFSCEFFRRAPLKVKTQHIRRVGEHVKKAAQLKFPVFFRCQLTDIVMKEQLWVNAADEASSQLLWWMSSSFAIYCVTADPAGMGTGAVTLLTIEQTCNLQLCQRNLWVHGWLWLHLPQVELKLNANN